MSVYLWQDFEGSSDGYRKVYRDGKKATPRFPYKNTVYAVENEPTPENIVSLLEQIWAEDWPVAISQFGPKPFEEIRDACCDEGRPVCDPEEGWFRRHGKALDETLMDFVVLDFDCEESTVSWDSTLNSRLDAAKSLLPLLEGLETVAFLSSSAYYRDPAKAHRMSLHVLVWLDKPYTRWEVASFLKRNENVVDKHMAVLTQPHIVANPRFLNTPRLKIEGPRILHTPGKRLCLDKVVPRAIHTSKKPNASKNSGGGVFTDLKELAEDLLERAKAGELDGRRTQILYEAIYRANWFHDGDTQEFLKDIDVPEITTGAGGRHDIYKMDADAKANIKRELTGEERNATRAKDTKILRHLDLADYDIEDLPTKNCVITLKSGCGSGKTKGFIKRFVEKTGYTRALYVSVYKGTIEPTAREIDFSYYLEMGEDAKHEWMNKQSKLASTDKSLKSLFNREGRYLRYQLLIIDECERVALNSLDTHSNQTELYDIALTANAVLMCDADISDELTNWFAKEIANKSTERKELIKLINTADWMGADGGHEVYRLEEEKDVVEITNRLLQKDQRVYMHVGYSDRTEKQRISALVSYFQEEFPTKKIYGYDANTAPNKLRKSPNEFIDELIEGEGLDLLILSPWSHIGWDYNSKAHLFDATVGSYPHSFMTAPDIAQAMRRPRQTKLHYVWIGKRPKKAFDKKREFEETWKHHPEIRALCRDVPQELANKARAVKVVQESNVSYHFKLLMEERGANFHRADTFDIDVKYLKWLLTQYGKEAHEDRISRIFNEEPRARDSILRNFYVWNGESRRFLNHAFEEDKEPPLHEEEFSDLYLRNERIQGRDIGAIADIWFRTPEQREWLDEKDSRYFAEMTGKLLDHIDYIVRLRYGNPDSFLSWLLDDDSEELHVSFNEEDVKDFMSWAEHLKYRLEQAAPWLRYAGLNASRASFIRSVANWFDCHVYKVSQIERIKKVEVGNNVIRYYMELGLIPMSRAAKIPKKKDKLQQVDAILDEKLRNHEPLGHHETEWLSFRFRYNLKITKNFYRSAFIREQLEKAR